MRYIRRRNRLREQWEHPLENTTDLTDQIQSLLYFWNDNLVKDNSLCYFLYFIKFRIALDLFQEEEITSFHLFVKIVKFSRSSQYQLWLMIFYYNRAYSVVNLSHRLVNYIILDDARGFCCANFLLNRLCSDCLWLTTKTHLPIRASGFLWWLLLLDIRLNFSHF
jgi:hypothetical protein